LNRARACVAAQSGASLGEKSDESRVN
jgi:hypothetical protein